jgi:glyoxylase-like metal-dependent hydrolase (beta-lactamase superfamily II)
MSSMDNTPALSDHPALAGITVLERGWLSSNNVLIRGAAQEPGATLIDASHVHHAKQTVDLVRHGLRGQTLWRIVNTHLHSDHCGGNAALQRAFGAELLIPPGQADAVMSWDADHLSFEATGQQIERFVPDAVLQPGSVLSAGDCRFEVLAAPGHDPHSLMLFERQRGLLISADALWENGFGVVFPELIGESAFDDVEHVLNLIATLPVQLVVPGHGAPFCEVGPALQRARSRLQSFRRDPERHARHAAKVLIKYHLMEERQMAEPALRAWTAATPLMQAVWSRYGQASSPTCEIWAGRFVEELVATGVLRREQGSVFDV